MQGQAQAKAVTFEEFERQRKGGGGRGPEGEGLLSRVWKSWASRILSDKLAQYEGNDMLTVAQFAEKNQLQQDFDRVSQSQWAARRVVRDHSVLLNSALVKPFKPLLPL